MRLRDMHVSGQVEIAASELPFFEVLNALKSSKLFSEAELRMAADSLFKLQDSAILAGQAARRKL